jgi:hypothetical protein
MGQPVVLRRRLPGLTQQPMQRNHVRDHKQGHVQDRNGIGSPTVLQQMEGWRGWRGNSRSGCLQMLLVFFWAVMAAREREDQRIVTL